MLTFGIKRDPCRALSPKSRKIQQLHGLGLNAEVGSGARSSCAGGWGAAGGLGSTWTQGYGLDGGDSSVIVLLFHKKKKPKTFKTPIPMIFHLILQGAGMGSNYTTNGQPGSRVRSEQCLALPLFPNPVFYGIMQCFGLERT